MKLKIYLIKNNMTMTEFCKKINHDITYISRIANGKRVAGMKLAKIIQEATNGEITIEDLRGTVDKENM